MHSARPVCKRNAQQLAAVAMAESHCSRQPHSFAYVDMHLFNCMWCTCITIYMFIRTCCMDVCVCVCVHLLQKKDFKLNF